MKIYQFVLSVAMSTKISTEDTIKYADHHGLNSALTNQSTQYNSTVQFAEARLDARTGVINSAERDCQDGESSSSAKEHAGKEPKQRCQLGPVRFVDQTSRSHDQRGPACPSTTDIRKMFS